MRMQDSGPVRLLQVGCDCTAAMNAQPWTLQRFRIDRLIGQGCASRVFEAVDQVTGETIALKAYHKARLCGLNLHQIHREIRIHAAFSHRSILRMHAAFEDDAAIFLVLEHCPKGDLFNYLRLRGKTLTESQAAKYVVEPLLQALHYLGQRAIIHRDIKPENILISETGTVKLADFGLSIVASEELPVTRVGTLAYMSPEVVACPRKVHPGDWKHRKDLAYGSQVDVWALGMLVFELVSPTTALEIDGHLSSTCQAFVKSCLTAEPKLRPPVDALLAHQWIAPVATSAPQKLPASRRRCESADAPRKVQEPSRCRLVDAARVEPLGQQCPNVPAPTGSVIVAGVKVPAAEKLPPHEASTCRAADGTAESVRLLQFVNRSLPTDVPDAPLVAKASAGTMTWHLVESDFRHRPLKPLQLDHTRVPESRTEQGQESEHCVPALKPTNLNAAYCAAVAAHAMDSGTPHHDSAGCPSAVLALLQATGGRSGMTAASWAQCGTVIPCRDAEPPAWPLRLDLQALGSLPGAPSEPRISAASKHASPLTAQPYAVRGSKGGYITPRRTLAVGSSHNSPLQVVPATPSPVDTACKYRGSHRMHALVPLRASSPRARSLRPTLSSASSILSAPNPTAPSPSARHPPTSSVTPRTSPLGGALPSPRPSCGSPAPPGGLLGYSSLSSTHRSPRPSHRRGSGSPSDAPVAIAPPRLLTRVYNSTPCEDPVAENRSVLPSSTSNPPACTGASMHSEISTFMSDDLVGAPVVPEPSGTPPRMSVQHTRSGSSVTEHSDNSLWPPAALAERSELSRPRPPLPPPCGSSPTLVECSELSPCAAASKLPPMLPHAGSCAADYALQTSVLSSPVDAYKAAALASPGRKPLGVSTFHNPNRLLHPLLRSASAPLDPKTLRERNVVEPSKACLGSVDRSALLDCEGLHIVCRCPQLAVCACKPCLP